MGKYSEKVSQYVRTLEKPVSEGDIASAQPVPEPRARIRTTRLQSLLIFAAFASAIVLLAWHPTVFVSVAGGIFLLLYTSIVGHKILAVVAGLLLHDEEEVGEPEIAGTRDEDLPLYTVMVPLYREAEIAGETVRAMAMLDYPRDRLDVILLVEEDDAETARAVEGIAMEHHFSVVKVPPGTPRTKPRACNFGLSMARGEFLVIFDAEDRPEADQLKKAVAVFRRSGPELACLQAKLNFYNSGDNLLTRCFALEYSTWFDLFLPGLHAIRCPIPLGGTSNHFRTDKLRAAGGWDSYNVTEDCDLGVELARRNMETRILGSTTWEECPADLMSWIKQRSRWMKGYLQTFLVHTRRPLRTALETGFARYFQMLVLVGGHLFSMMANPLSWVLLFCWAAFRWRIFFPEAPATLLVVVLSTILFSVNFVFLALHLLAGVNRGMEGALPAALYMPFYWALISLGALRGVLQFLRLPHFWDKTPHGRSRTEDAGKRGYGFIPARTQRVGALARALFFFTLVFLVLGIGAISVYIPIALHYPRQIRVAAISLGGPSTQSRKSLDCSWMDASTVEIRARIKADEKPSDGLFRFRVFLKVGDGEWYQHHVDEYAQDGDFAVMQVPLDSGWEAKDCDRPWGPWCLRRVRELGLKIFGEKDFPLRQVEIEDFRLVERKKDGNLDMSMISVPERAKQWETAEFAFSLSRRNTIIRSIRNR